jgi:hypothetical protein
VHTITNKTAKKVMFTTSIHLSDYGNKIACIQRQKLIYACKSYVTLTNMYPSLFYVSLINICLNMLHFQITDICPVCFFIS